MDTVFGSNTTISITSILTIVLILLSFSVQLSSITAIWLMVNQYQLLTLLPLTGVYLPTEVYEQMKGLTFSSYLFSFLPVIEIFPEQQLPVYFEQKDERLTDIELESGSTFINAFSLIVILCILLGRLLAFII